MCGSGLMLNRLSFELLKLQRRPPHFASLSTFANRSWPTSLRPRLASPSRFLHCSVRHKENNRDGDGHEAAGDNGQRRKSRAPGSKTSLRRVAVEAQRSRDGKWVDRESLKDADLRFKNIKAYCAAEQYDIRAVIRILKQNGYQIDPFKTNLLPQVVHIHIPSRQSHHLVQKTSNRDDDGDIFIFPSGAVVAWSVPDRISSMLVTDTLMPAAQNAHLAQMETEDMEYVEDPQRENSNLRGDTILLGTKSYESMRLESGQGAQGSTAHLGDPGLASHDPSHRSGEGHVNTILAKIAFSSGLARSTKLAVLESLLSNYFDSTRSIPTMLSKGSRLPFTRSFILRKTGQLLSVRAQLNLYSELTDSLPDLFWDSRHELGLEGYYDQVGRALDVGVRIKVLNEKMDYAQEIASVLRERLSEKHGLVLEWMIIALITIEVGFEILRLWKERKEDTRHA